MATSAGKSRSADRKVLRGLGILGLLGVGGAHLQYWSAMLRAIPTNQSIIGPLFEFTFIFAFVLALVMIVFPRALVAVVAALFSFATLGGYILSLLLPAGVFNYHDPGISYSGAIAIAAEVVGGLALLAWGGAGLLGGRSAKASSVPFGASTADAPGAAKRAKADKPARSKKVSVPFGATAADVAGGSAQTRVNPSTASVASSPKAPAKSSKSSESAKPAKPSKPAKSRSSVQEQIEQAQAAFQGGASPPTGRR